ncbi:MAG: BON domain-containing protein [Planctomycetota bacterium]|nr:MAG: BON domain-containing protein [Planctomycetota bacterium]
MPLRMTSLAVWACFLCSISMAVAQTGGTTSGGVSQRAPTQATNLSNSATSTSAGATGGTTQRAGGTTAPSGGTNDPAFNAADGSLGAQIGQGGFTGRQNTGFAGNRNAGQGGGASLTPQFNQMGGNQNSNRGNTGGNANIKRARPQQRIAFTFPKANLTSTQVQVSQRFQRLAGVTGATTEITDEGVATLTGTVATDDAKKLAEALVRLEPGVRSVVNELLVQP